MDILADAVLFDMDGTLVDSTPVVNRIWIEFATRHRVDHAELLRYAHGRQTRDTVAKFLPAGYDVDGETAVIDHAEVTDTDGIVEIPGARELVGRIPGSRVAIVTSASRELATVRLAAAGVPVPEVMVCAGEIARGKPDPEGYQVAARRLGVAPRDCVVFEDVEAGIRAGLASGAQVIVVGPHESETTADLPRVRDLSAVTASAVDGRIRLSWTTA